MCLCVSQACQPTGTPTWTGWKRAAALLPATTGPTLTSPRFKVAHAASGPGAVNVNRILDEYRWSALLQPFLTPWELIKCLWCWAVSLMKTLGFLSALSCKFFLEAQFYNIQCCNITGLIKDIILRLRGYHCLSPSRFLWYTGSLFSSCMMWIIQLGPGSASYHGQCTKPATSTHDGWWWLVL